ncbi:MAG TPA: helix-turn-helix domain-containing protein [Candidatus Binatia bacterium]|nr:helix-turn-helix domain-containing protein [Candidatus Binatia bacterium]
MKRMRREATPEQVALTVPQAAAITGQSERAVWLDISRCRFPHRRHGRKVIILRDELLAFLKSLPGVSLEEARERAGNE